MIRRVLLWAMGGGLALAVVAAGLLYWFLSNDGIRVALEQQASAWLGQPVRIAKVGAQFWPRPGVTLEQVAIGQPARLTLAEVGVSTELSALLRRRIADGAVRIRNTRLELPLPFEIPTTSGGANEPSAFAVESINSIGLDNVRIVSRGRELVLSLDSSFDGARLTIRRATVESGKTSIRAEGVVTLEPRVDARLKAAANRLDVDELMALADAFGPATATPGARGKPGPPPRIAARISAESASAGGVEVRQFASDVQVDGDAVTMSPLTFQLFGGRYEGSLSARLGNTLTATLRSRLSDLDVAQLAEFGNAKDTMTGKLTGAGTFTGSGRDFAAVLAGARGTGTAKITNGTIRRLGLVRTIVVFFGKPAADAPGASDAFDSLDLQFALQNQLFRADAMSLHSRDVDLVGTGTLATATKALAGKFDVSLSEALSAQSGNDLQRFTREGNRVVLPANVGGTLDSPRVTIDAASAVKRGLRNEVEGRLKGLLDRFGTSKPQ
ncbi:MAG TPA: AsmA-like C-terminal region-containing protein [Vicinamibacterales bacterium]|jgi:hypothetical protein|nr:AsmA-like C-terminal region-containing protein [Vicinamibacterales bacterium]